MKVLYIANNRIPTEKAHGIQIAKMCEAFERFSELKLIVPKRNNFIQKDIFDYYKLENNFEIKYLSAIDLVGTIPRFGFWLSSWSFAKKAKKYLSFKKYKGVVYSRDLFVLWLLKDNKNYDLVYEIHNFPKNLNYFHKKLFPYLKFVAISNGLKKELLNFGIKEERVLASHDGVDLKQFDIQLSKKEAREKLDLDQNKKIALYAGHLYDWKGAQTLADASKFLDQNTTVVFIGGTDKDIETFQEKNKDYKNILIAGRKPHEKVPIYLRAADALILPNSGKEKVSRYYTSPMKLFEYMASGRPIVASALPSIKEVLNDKNAILFEPDSPDSLAKGIKTALLDEGFSAKISQQALVDVAKYSWDTRSKNIINFIG
ncbi:glycosyltransferase [Candidatus Parcubacteria bacterium]|jgi:glycosyltransferase involved in cell wall biosynthesis|nr:glycosyltransferase [Candidatus Parcubacteria bacterium]